MKNALMQLNQVEKEFFFQGHKIQQITKVHPKTGAFIHQIFIDDILLEHLKTANTQNPIIYNDQLYFLSDKTGLNQLYAYHFEDKVMKKITSFKYGVIDYFNEGQRLIIKTIAREQFEVITKQLNKAEIKNLQFSLEHDCKMIDSLSLFNEEGYHPFIEIFYSYKTKLSKLSYYDYPITGNSYFFQGNLINDSYKKNIIVLNNQLRKEVLEYFHQKRFNIYCVNSLERIKTIKGKKYAFFFEDGLINNPAIKGIKKAVSFQSKTDSCISLGLTSEEITIGQERLVDKWSAIAKQSTIKNVDQISYDLLLIHPQKDYSHPLEEAELLYSALKDRKEDVNVQMVVVPKEKDDFFLWGNIYKQIAVYDVIIQWLKRGK